MAKMRVHELAKELEIKSQEIIDSLSGTEYEIKSASNNIDDAAQEIIRKKYKKSAPKAEEKPIDIEAMFNQLRNDVCSEISEIKSMFPTQMSGTPELKQNGGKQR